MSAPVSRTRALDPLGSGTDDAVVLAAADLDAGYRLGRGRRRVVMSGVRVALRAGELACLVGPNGAGKSTLLRTLTGLQPPLAGTVWLDGAPLASMARAERARRIAVVSTERPMVGQLRAYDLVALGRYPHTRWSGRLDQADHDAVGRALHQTGSTHLAGRLVTELSDGERQRVMVARALAQDPAVLVLDEPTAFLDVRARMELVVLLLDLTRASRLAVLLSTHDLEVMLRHAETVWLATAQGRLHLGAPEDLALDGSLERAFSGAGGYRFDPATMRFHTQPQPLGTAYLEGEGPARGWAERALARAGIAVVGEGSTDLRVICENRADGPRWRLHHATGATDHHLPGTLANHARVLVATAPGPPRGAKLARDGDG